jgi:c-di-GMP-binding flagellar brake protein YcgR
VSPSPPVSTHVVTDGSWMRGLHPGHQVDLEVYGQRMTGKVLKTAQDNITVRMPIDEQSGDVRRFSVTGTAVISIEAAAARVPVSVQSTGEYVRLQVIGPAEIIQRRLHRRATISVPARLAWRSAGDGRVRWAESHTVDISVGGVRIASARTVWPGLSERVDVAIQLPSGDVTEQATVIGKTPAYDLRLEFAGVAARTREAIEELVEESVRKGIGQA